MAAWLSALLLLATFSGRARAATIVWAGGTGAWATAENWVGGVAPTSSDTVAFKGWMPLATSGWTVTASATKAGDTTSEVNDGRRSTVWSTGNSQSTDDWIKVDLGSNQTFARVDVDVASGTSTEYIRGYNLEVSTDNNSWTSVATGTGTTLLTSITFADQTARYIRITCTSTIANNWTVGELIVWGTGSLGTRFTHTGWMASASQSAGGQPASNAVDTDVTSRWGSGGTQSNGMWFKVDLGSSLTFTALSIDAYSNTEGYPRGLTIEVSTDNSNWTTVASGITPAGEFVLASFTQQTARYIRLTQTGTYAGPWYINDFNVYGTPANASLAASTTIAALEIRNAVTLTPAAAVALTITGSFTQTAGTFAAGTGTLSIGDDYSLSGGTFTGSSGALTIADDFNLSSTATFTAPSGVMEVAGAFNRTGGTFTHNSGRVIVSGTGSETFATGGSTFNSLYLSDGVVAYWPFEETASPSTDFSGWGRTATWVNSPDDSTTIPTTNAPNERSLGFSAANSHATFDSPEVSAISVSVWVYSTSRNSTFPRIFDMPGYELGFSNGAQVAPQVNNAISWTGTLSSGNNSWRTEADSISDGAWYHIVATMTAGGVPTVYINGNARTLTQPTTPSGTQLANTGTGYIGNSPALDRAWNGYIDDLRIYKRVLSAAEAAALHAGGLRTTTTGTQTLSGSVTTANDLVLAGGKLDVSASACSSASCGITIGGSWHNHASTFTARTGTVTFNGTGTTYVIRSDRHWFYDLTFGNTGTWTLQDRLNASGQLTMSADGTLAAGTYNLHAGSLSKSTGTISGTGVLALNPTSNTTLTVNSLGPKLRVEAPRETGLVGHWKLDEGIGTTIADLSGNGNSGTLSSAARWVTSSLPSTTFDNRAAVNLGGTSHGTLGITGIPLLSAAKSITCWVNLTTTANVQHMVSFDDQNGNSIGIGMRGGVLAAWRGGGTVLAQVAAPSTGTWVHVAYTWDGTTHKIYLNGGTPGTGTGSPNSSAVTRGYIGTWDGINELLYGQIDDVRVYNVALTAGEVAHLAAGRYAGLGHTTTVTLAANSAVSGGLHIDNGTLASSSYTMNAALTTEAVTVNSGGTYQVGSATQTMAGGLSVGSAGGLSLPTAGGTIAIGSGKTLTMDGALSASSASAAIQSVSGTYAFRVGSVSGATPTLNITGLQVKNTTADGMFINYNTGATTTFTRFDNIAFSSGAGTGAGNYNLQIYATSLYLSSNGCTFDNGVSATVANNVRLTGNGGGAGSETRAIFGGATCASNQGSCEAYDSDDDATADGVGDNTGSNGAVVQWVKTVGTDTAGTIEGFPTAAFDWNTFTYYATYVAYHDTSGTVDTVYARSSTGTASYSWNTSSGEEIIGSQRWDTAGGVHHVYIATTGGKVYRLVDNGSTLTADTASPWDGANNPYDCSCTITTPLAQNTNFLYWGGSVGGTHKLWTLSKTSTTRLPGGSPLSTSTTTTNAAPTVWTSGGSSYVFLGLAGRVAKVDVTAQANVADNVNPGGTNAVTGRITVVANKLYAGDDNGNLWCLDPGTNFGATAGTYKNWSYVTHASCGGVCQIKSHYFDPTATNVYFGDQDGHLYVVDSSGNAKTGYPYRPGTASDAFATAIFHRSGVILAGTTTGTLYVIDQSTNGTNPGLIRTYQFGASTRISGIAYNANATAYMIATANDTSKDGKLYYIDLVSDPTSSYP